MNMTKRRERNQLVPLPSFLCFFLMLLRVHNELADHLSSVQQFMGLPGFGEGQILVDEGLDPPIPDHLKALLSIGQPPLRLIVKRMEGETPDGVSVPCPLDDGVQLIQLRGAIQPVVEHDLTKIRSSVRPLSRR